jgi:hypothetical protein
MVRPIDLTVIYMSLEDVSVCAGLKVLMEIANNSALIVGDPQHILAHSSPIALNKLYYCQIYLFINHKLVNYPAQRKNQKKGNNP